MVTSSALNVQGFNHGWSSRSRHVARRVGSSTNVRARKSAKSAASGAFRLRMDRSKGILSGAGILSVPGEGETNAKASSA